MSNRDWFNRQSNGKIIDNKNNKAEKIIYEQEKNEQRK